MAQKGVQLDRETFSCSVCLDLLKEPVTIPCGHNYCMNCIKNFWDDEDKKKIHSCPQCRQTFTPRPVLVKNTMLAALVEKLKKTGLQAAPANHCYAGPEDVACDICTGRKLKALKSCLVCLISYCEEHLQPHHDVAQLKKHKLVEASDKLQENICSRHDEVMKMFCRNDQQCICYLCSVDEHKGHNMVSATAERTEKQKELQVNQKKIQQKIYDREKDMKVLKQEVETINRSADEAVKDSEEIFTEMIHLIEKRGSEVKLQVRSQQETEVKRVKELQEKLEQEITELKEKDAEMKKLLDTEDHNRFLHSYPYLSQLSESTESSSEGIKICPQRYFEDVAATVSGLRVKLQDVLKGKCTNTSVKVADPAQKVTDPPQKEPDPSQKVADQPQKVADPSQKVADPPQKVPDSPQKVADPSQKVADPPQKVADPPQKEPDPSQKVADQPQKVPDSPQKVADQPQKVPDSPQKVPDPPQKVADPSQRVASLPLASCLPQPEPTTRREFLKYSRDITLDPNTAHHHLLLSEGNRKATVSELLVLYPFHPERFTYWYQVLGKESLTGRCYWEVKWAGEGFYLAIAYRNIRRNGSSDECRFGSYNSWALKCDLDGYRLWNNNVSTSITARRSSRLGVYLDHSAGILSFYAVTDTMIPLIRVQTIFTQPLYAGLSFPNVCGNSAEFCKLK